MTDGGRRIASEGRRVRRSYSLVEVVISTLVVSGMLVAALQTVTVARLGHARLADRGRGLLLAQSLMAEIMQRDYQDPNETPVFGREASEVSATRADFDDVDDYLGWKASPPQTRDGGQLVQYEGWTREVEVLLVRAGDLSDVSYDAVDEYIGVGVPPTDEGLKRITVIVRHNGIEVAELTALRSLAWVRPNARLTLEEADPVPEIVTEAP